MPLIDVLTGEERALFAKVRGLRRSARQLEGEIDRLLQRRVELEGVVDELIMIAAGRKTNLPDPRADEPHYIDDDGTPF